MKLLPQASVRVRLTGWYLFSILILVTAFAASTLSMVQRRLVSGLDRSLRGELVSMSDRWRLGLPLEALTPPRGTFEHAESTDIVLDMWIHDELDGKIVYERRVRGPAAALQIPLAQPLLSQKDLEAWNTGDERWRSMYTRLDSNAVRRRVLQASLPLTPTRIVMEEAARLALIGLLMTMALACVGGWWIAGHALRPVGDLVRRTRALSASAPGARLPPLSESSEMSELTDVINDLLSRIQRAREREARFATEAAHELRTPLTAQRSIGEMALRVESDVATLRETIASMLEEGQHMHRLVDGLLTIARAESGSLPRTAGTTDVGALTDGCVQTMQPLAESRGQTLRAAIALESLHAAVDSTLLRQVLLNLVHNAIEHTPATTCIDVAVEAHHGEVLIRVCDNGPGFDAAESAGQLIRRSGRPPADGRARHLGLGLSIASSLVAAQGGRMSIVSAPGRGTQIELRFPGQDATAAA